MGLIFKLGTMGSAKTLNLLAQRHDLISKGRSVAVVVPSVDKRHGEGVVKSRSGLEAKADIILARDEELKVNFKVDRVLVDEVQFFSEKTIESFRSYADAHQDIDVVCYGLRTDFTSRLFEGSKRLLELADDIKVIHAECCYCANKHAAFNLRLDLFAEEQVLLGGSELYKEVCSVCYTEERGGLS